MPSPLTASVTAAAILALVPLAAQAQGQATGLPPGVGKELVEGLCVSCHQTNLITASSGYTRDGWKELIGTMIDLTRTSSEAVRDLKTYLDFAERGPAALGGAIRSESRNAYANDFEEAVAEGLRRRGWTVHTQIGVSKFAIDLGVRYHANGEVRYLREGSIVDLPDGTVQINPIQSEANLVTFRVGVSFTGR